MKMKKHITNEKNGIKHTLFGDYCLPDLALPEKQFCWHIQLW